MNESGSELISSVSTLSNGLEISWMNGDRSFFHHVWLRDCCYCDECGDCHSSLRRYVPGLESLSIRPQSVKWDGSRLTVEWKPDAHRSEFSGEWLYTFRYDDKARAVRRPDSTFWDALLSLDDVTFDYALVSRDDQIRLKLHQCLISHGFVIVQNGPSSADGVLSFAELVGEVEQSAYGAVFDLTPGNAVGTAGTTLRAVPPHSDEAFAFNPPGIETLACVQPADEGGDSILVDGFRIAQKLRGDSPTGFDLLAKWNHHYVRRHGDTLDQRAHMPVIALDDDGEISGIRLHTRASAPLDLPEHVMENYLHAYHRLCAMMMAPENQIKVRLDSGDAIIFDNHRALHSRTEFSDRRRFLQICSVPREKFHQEYRLLAARLGHTAAANSVLRAGACR
ncbi:MAG: TauD/TfdA family dioxygenase [Pseudomonadota bacterium]